MWIIFALGICIFPDTILGVKYPEPTCYKKTNTFGSCIDKYVAMPGHINCRFPSSGRPDNASGEAEIVNIHNSLRSNVQPSAANMIALEYTSGLQHAAQRWTRLCSVDSNWFERTTPGAFIHGQNTYRSPTKVTWKDVLDVWKAENTSFTYGHSNNASLVGNYTQMISANTTALGCGVSDCHGFFLYMCLYIPMLNPVNIDTPYKSGQAIEDCQNNHNSSDYLCDCNGVTCLGGSTLNLTTCSCECIKTMGDAEMYNGTLCELTCSDPLGDDPACGKPPYTNDSCDTNMDTMFHCPYMCYACPYAGKNYAMGSELLPWEKGLSNCTTTTKPPATTTPLATTIVVGYTGGTTALSGSVSTTRSSANGGGSSITKGGGTGDGSNGSIGSVSSTTIGSGNSPGSLGYTVGGNVSSNGGITGPVSSTTRSGNTIGNVGSGGMTSLSANTSAVDNAVHPTESPGSNPGLLGGNAGNRNGMSVFRSICLFIVPAVFVFV